MIYGEPQVHVLRDVTDLIGIRTLMLRKYWQPSGTVRSQADIDAQKPLPPGVPGGVILMGEQHLKERGRMSTIWTFQGVNGDGRTVTFRNRSNSLDYGFDPGFAQVPIQAHPEFPSLSKKYGAYPSNDGTTVLWPPDLSNGEGTGGGLLKHSGGGGGGGLAGYNPMYGIQAYFEMEGVYRYRYAEKEFPKELLAGVGFIEDKMPGIPPAVADGRNWLKAPPSYQRKGVVFDITEFYWLSRRGGWPEPVYRPGGGGAGATSGRPSVLGAQRINNGQLTQA